MPKKKAKSHKTPKDVERAGSGETPEGPKRATVPKTPSDKKRAESGETPEGPKRAKQSETPRASERAIEEEKPNAQERAEAVKSPDTAERAESHESPKAEERASKKPKRKTSYIRFLVRAFYDLQKLRMQTQLRISAVDRGAADMLDRDAGVLEDYFTQLQVLEKEVLEDRIAATVRVHPLAPFFDGVKGCGPTMTAVLLSEVDIHRANRPSNLWRYAGYGVKDGARESLKKGQKAPYNAFLKTKLYVLAGCIMKAKGEPYTTIYEGAKLRYRSMPCGKDPTSHCPTGTKDPAQNITARWIGVFMDAEAKALIEREHPGLTVAERTKLMPEARKKVAEMAPGRVEKLAQAMYRKCYCTPAHSHMKAVRYMIKMFLYDLWRYWREAEGLPIVGSYAEDKLGRRHGE